jgi:hypothetical protein
MTNLHSAVQRREVKSIKVVVARRRIDAIVRDDDKQTAKLLTSPPTLVQSLVAVPHLYGSGIQHWLYGGDSALHLAAAGHRAQVLGQ